MKYATYLFIKRLAGLGEYRLLATKRRCDYSQVARHLPLHEKRYLTTRRQGQFMFWSTAIGCTVTIMQVLPSQGITRLRL